LYWLKEENFQDFCLPHEARQRNSLKTKTLAVAINLLMQDVVLKSSRGGIVIKLITCGKTLSVLALLLTGSVSSALADQSHVSMQFDGVVNPSATWAGPGETVYVSPYTATDLSTTPNAQITIYCLDWNHNIDFGQDWTADFLSLAPTNPDLSDLYYYNSTTAYQLGQSSPGTDTLTSVAVNQTEMYDRYLEAAWLFTQIQNLGTLNSADATTEDELNVAAWTLFLDADPPVSSGTDHAAFAADINAGGSSFANLVYSDLQNAQAAVSGGYTAPGWYAITPYDKTPGSGDVTQEFLAHDPVPEPQAILLFGTLVGILGATRYRRRKRA
jgi:hypothetical protein